MKYQPALDGLRAVAVAMVLLFHGQVSWMRGGYFGVSMFFTLSGYLITSLLVKEYASTNRISPQAFYARRLRRLMPASLVCLASVCILGAFEVWNGVDHLRRDVLGALFQVANWVQLFAGESYTDLQSRNAGLTSPLDHYWSLAIEEQFYWIWPLAFWALARVARKRGWSLTWVMVGLTVTFAASAPLIAAWWGRDAAYWATPARAGEILVGATLAVAVAAGALQARAWMAPTAGLMVFVLGVALPAAGGPAYHGAFPVLSIASGLLLLGLQRPGVVTTLLSARPLVGVGKVSYGMYLYHFPIYVLMTPSRLGISGVGLLVLRIGSTLVVAIISFWLIERPIRFGTHSPSRTVAWSAAATIAVGGLVLAVPAAGAASYYTPDADLVDAAGIQPLGNLSPLVVVTAPPTLDAQDEATAADELSGAAETANTTAATNELSSIGADSEPAVAVLSRPARILVVGDSTAEATGAGLVAWAAANPDLAQVSLAVSGGCGFVRGGVAPTDEGRPFQEECDKLLDERLPADLLELQPDVVMLMVTSRDIVPRIWNEDEGVLDPLDSRFVARMRLDYQVITNLVVSTTRARVVWIRAPKTDPYWLGEPHPFIDPTLLSIRQDVIADTVANNADRSQVLDLRAWMERDGIARDEDARPDGLHLTPRASLYVARTWLGPQLVSAAAANALQLADETSADTAAGQPPR